MQASAESEATTSERVAQLEADGLAHAVNFRRLDFAVLKLNWKLWFLILVTGADIGITIYERLAG